MCTLTHFAVAYEQPFDLNNPDFGTDSAPDSSGREPQFQVILAGNAFFHIKEKSTGRVRGFREDHNAACALARSLESRIELLPNVPLR
ncbi:MULTISPECIES: hypothetical protein [Pseudomonas]|uniref:Uncharacterized protein n=1 Tax=Pseudomonas fluorescens TaxID=294 RepID=A0A7Z3C684_PSEFL|nr:hypothetical protein [Pseudomonas fluorescens]QJP96105.1 hypothetical protein C6Y56_16570 [Pseudomonas fluorescens]